ncbi:FAM18-like protein [Cryptosporidium felis]|nr:FAM18-like protein [Cryptosporidium felis]
MELEFVGVGNLSTSASIGEMNGLRSGDVMMKEETTDKPILINIMNSSSHPTICLFQILFKILAFLTFLFGSFFFHFFSKNSFIMTFFLTTVFFSLDFWTVKNVTGRILIGMRWWYEVNKDGETVWMFENCSEQKNSNGSKSSSTDKSIFWITTYAWTLLWGVILFFQFFSFKFQWIPLSVIAILLSSSNLIGYTKCVRFSKNSQKDWITNIAVRTIINNAQNIV